MLLRFTPLIEWQYFDMLVNKNNPNFFYSQASANSANQDMHVLQCHGDADPLVPFIFGSQTAEKMKSLINPSNVTFKSYRGLIHSACPEVSVEGNVCTSCAPAVLSYVWCKIFCPHRKWWMSRNLSRSSFLQSVMSKLQRSCTAPWEPPGLDASEALWTWGTTDLLDDQTKLLLLEPDWTGATARERHECNDAASWLRATHSRQCYRIKEH